MSVLKVSSRNRASCPLTRKDEEVTRVADDSVLEFVVVNLCKELMGEGEVELVLACFG